MEEQPPSRERVSSGGSGTIISQSGVQSDSFLSDSHSQHLDEPSSCTSSSSSSSSKGCEEQAIVVAGTSQSSRTQLNLDVYVVLHILSYQHPDLHRMVSKSLSAYNQPHNRNTEHPASLLGSHLSEYSRLMGPTSKLPISLLVLTNTYQEYLNVTVQFRHGMCWRAARCGNLPALQWFRSQGPEDMQAYYTYTPPVPLQFTPQQQELLQWAREKGCPVEELFPPSDCDHDITFSMLALQRQLDSSFDAESGAFCSDLTECYLLPEGGSLRGKKSDGDKFFPWGAKTCSMAACYGHMEVLQWARQQGCPWDSCASFMAAGNGHLEVLQSMRQQGCPWDEATCEMAAGSGHLEVLKWARKMGCPWGEETCSAAAKYGHMEVLKWAMKQDCPFTNVCSVAAAWGRLDILKLAAAKLEENPDGDNDVDDEINQKTCANAALHGHLPILRWIKRRGRPYPWTQSTCSSAAKGGHLEILVWARKYRCPWDETTCTAAAFRGRLDILMWAREHGCPWDKNTCSLAAFSGDLKVLQWARGQGCPWDEETCLAAAQRRHLHILQWARENDCPWNKDSCLRVATIGEHHHVVEWMSSLEL